MHKNNFFRSYGFWHWGEGFQTVLFTWYMAFHAELSASQIGLYQSLVLSPFLVFTVFGGALTDKIGAKFSYGASTSVFAIVLVSYGAIDFGFGFIPEAFFIYCVSVGIVSAISNPAIDTFIPNATAQPVRDNSLLAANVHNIAKLTGTVSGLLLPILTALGGFVANGLLMFLSALFLQAHHDTNQNVPSAKAEPIPASLGKFRTVISHYRSCPENFDILLSSCLLGLVIVPAGYILLPLTLREKFPESGDMIALIGISSWIGAILATMLAKRFSSSIRRPGAISLGLWALYGAGLLILISVGSFYELCFMVFLFGSAKTGKALVYGNYLSNSPAGDRGLIIAVDQTAFWGLATIGTAAMGLSVEKYGLDRTITLVSGCILVGVLILSVRGRLLAIA